MFRPGQWAYGNDYVVSFVARLDGRGTREAVPTVLLDARASSRIFRRFALSGNSRAGFMAREQWMRSGACAEFETGRDHDVRIVVRGDLGMVLLDGRAAWVGTMGPATTGGLALGVRHGKLTVKNLHVRKIER